MARVLIIEDDRELTKVLAEALTGAGHQVLEAGDGVDGLRLLLDKTPDLVLTDIVMPQLDGLQLLQILLELRSAKSRLKIIAMSGAPDRANVLMIAAKLGANKVLSKPFTRQDFLQTVERVLTE